jgi:hypothetical protein
VNIHGGNYIYELNFGKTIVDSRSTLRGANLAGNMEILKNVISSEEPKMREEQETKLSQKHFVGFMLALTLSVLLWGVFLYYFSEF